MFLKHPCDEGVVRAARCPERAPDHRRWILLATILGSSLAFIDGTVVNVALPALQRGLGATVADVQWIVAAYALLFSTLLLVGGSLGDRFGRRRVYAIGIAWFAGASMLCGLAGSVRVLVMARALQGIGAALLVPGSLAILAASFPERERGRAIGTWSGFSAITAAFGPVLGGWLVDHGSWRWAFYLNLPIAATTLALLIRYVPESRDPDAPGRLDGWGAALVTAGLGGIVYGLIESSARGWRDPLIVGATLGGVIGLGAFFAVESRSRAPMLPLSLFRSRPFVGANLLTLALYGALTMAMFVLPLDLIQVQGFSATRAGAAILPLIVMIFLLSRWSGGLLDRFGARLPLIVGPLIVMAGLVLLARPGVGGSYWTTFFPAIAVLGVGMGVTVAPLTTTVMNAVSVSRAGVASGINNAVSRVAGLLAIAIISAPLLHVFTLRLEQGLRDRGVRAQLVAEVQAQRLKLANVQAPASASPAERRAIQQAVADAFVSAFRTVVLAAAALALAAAAIAAVTLDARQRPPAGTRGRRRGQPDPPGPDT